MPTREELSARKDARIEELHRFGRGRTALLVIDMQRAFVDPGAALAVPQAREIIPNLETRTPRSVSSAGSAADPCGFAIAPAPPWNRCR